MLYQHNFEGPINSPKLNKKKYMLFCSTGWSMGSDNCNIALTYWKMPQPDK